MFNIRIDKGYCKGTLASLIGCAIISTTYLATLVGTTCIIISSFFFYDKFPWHDLFFHSLNMLVVI
jgi:hypothetical protein